MDFQTSFLKLNTIFVSNSFLFKMRCKIFGSFTLLFFALNTAGAQLPESVPFCKITQTQQSGFQNSQFRDETIRNYLDDKHIVYIGGFFGEKQFSTNEQALKKIQPNINFSIINPPTKKSTLENSILIDQELRKISTKFPNKKIILIGHSKGGPEVIQLAVDHPEIFESDVRGYTIDTIIPIHAAVGGSLLPDLEFRENPEINAAWDQYLVEINRQPAWWEYFIKYLLVDNSSDGFRSLSTKESTLRKNEIETKVQNRRPFYQTRLLFVSSWMQNPNEGLPFYLKILSGFLHRFNMRHDGLLFEKDQVLDNVGTHLISVENASHFALTSSYGPASCRQEFMTYLMYKIAQYKKFSMIGLGE